jgi:hypothetical protein
MTAIVAAFPDGISRHGVQYGVSLSSMGPIEIPFELVRQSEFPESLSRFQSVFASRTIKEAHEFAARVKSIDYQIWEVDAEHAEEHDMNLLSQPVNLAHLLINARGYWGAPPGVGAFIEVLLKPPVTLLRAVFDSSAKMSGNP